MITNNMIYVYTKDVLVVNECFSVQSTGPLDVITCYAHDPPIVFGPLLPNHHGGL